VTRVEGSFEPGHGQLDLAGFVRGSPSGITAGAEADLQARLSQSLAAYLHGELGVNQAGWDAQALAGLRMRW
jgi:hypothetical protein